MTAKRNTQFSPAGTIYPFMGNACMQVNVCCTMSGKGTAVVGTRNRDTAPLLANQQHVNSDDTSTLDDQARSPAPRATPSRRGGKSNGVPNGNASQSTPIQEPEPSHENTVVKGTQDDPARSPTPRATPPGQGGNSNGMPNGNASQSTPIQEPEPSHENTAVKGTQDDPAHSPTTMATSTERESNSNGGSMGNASPSRVPTPAPIQESEQNHENTHVKTAQDYPGDARTPIQETSKNK